MRPYRSSRRRVIAGRIERFCLGCRAWKQLGELVRDKRCQDGRRPMCRVCEYLPIKNREESDVTKRAKRKYNREHYRANAEKLKARRRARYRAKVLARQVAA